MKKLLLAATLATLSATVLQGCVVAHATGQSVVAGAAPDNHLHVVIVPAKWASDGRPNAARVAADRHLATLFPALATRLPEDFRANGLEADASLLEAADSPLPPPTAVRTLVIQPAQAGFINYSAATWLDLSVTLVDAKLGVLWKGSIRMSTGSPGVSYDASAVDHAAVPLLEQLRDAKLIDISWRRPTTP
jgi:hypothetical protein